MPQYEHQVFIPLKEEVTLWRYIDLERFKSLLETKSLFFCRADKFSDPFEGSIPKLEADYRINVQQMLAEKSDRVFDENVALRNIDGLSKQHQLQKKSTIINCWHINQNESDAMWRLYLKDNEGVAIQSNSKRMHATIANASASIGLSKVRYINYDTDIWAHAIDYPHTYYNTITPLIHKRIEFMHEHELRLLIIVDEANETETYWDAQPNHKGKLVPIDLEILIEKIYLPPTVDKKTADIIQNISKDSGYNFIFTNSNLSSNPRY